MSAQPGSSTGSAAWTSVASPPAEAQRRGRPSLFRVRRSGDRDRLRPYFSRPVTDRYQAFGHELCWPAPPALPEDLQVRSSMTCGHDRAISPTRARHRDRGTEAAIDTEAVERGPSRGPSRTFEPAGKREIARGSEAGRPGIPSAEPTVWVVGPALRTARVGVKPGAAGDSTSRYPEHQASRARRAGSARPVGAARSARRRARQARPAGRPT